MTPPRTSDRRSPTTLITSISIDAGVQLSPHALSFPARYLSRNNTGLIGNVKDPETGTYVAGDYMTQLGVLPTFSLDTLEYIRNAHEGSIEADSCYLLVSYKTSYGDTLAPMKATAYEMSKPMSEKIRSITQTMMPSRTTG